MDCVRKHLGAGCARVPGPGQGPFGHNLEITPSRPRLAALQVQVWGGEHPLPPPSVVLQQGTILLSGGIGRGSEAGTGARRADWVFSAVRFLFFSRGYPQKRHRSNARSYVTANIYFPNLTADTTNGFFLHYMGHR